MGAGRPTTDGDNRGHSNGLLGRRWASLVGANWEHLGDLMQMNYTQPSPLIADG